MVARFVRLFFLARYDILFWSLRAQQKFGTVHQTAKEFEGAVWVNGYRLGGGRLVAAVDLLVFVRMLFYLMAYFGCVTKKLCAPKNEQTIHSKMRQEKGKKSGGCPPPPKNVDRHISEYVDRLRCIR